MSTHARDIRYQKFCGQQTVTDTSPACISACGDWG